MSHKKTSTSLLLYLLLILTAPLTLGCASSWLKSGDSRAGKTASIDDSSEGISIDRDIAESFTDRITGRNVAADIPYAQKLPWVGAPDPNEQTARGHFADGEKAFRERKYAAARASYEKAALNFPDSPLHEDALLMVAETYFFEDDYPEAFTGYESLLTKFKRSRHLDTAVKRQFAIGQYWQQQNQEEPRSFLTPNLTDKTLPFNDTRGRALRAFEKVRLNHPTGSLADDSLMATGGSMFAKEQFEDADYFYTLLRREYPQSEHQYQAHVLGIQAKIRSYQGPEYDGTVLEEAKELTEQTLKQFVQMPPEDRQRLQDLYGKILNNLAIRDYEMARFYDVKDYFGAARLYYDRVAREFPQTSVAVKAQERIAQLDGKPNTPAPRFTWISSLFPDEREDLLKIDAATAPGTVQR